MVVLCQPLQVHHQLVPVVVAEVAVLDGLPGRNEGDPRLELLLSEVHDGFAGDPGRSLAPLEIDGRIGKAALRIDPEAPVHGRPALVLEPLVLGPARHDDPTSDVDGFGRHDAHAARRGEDGHGAKGSHSFP
jgi:hypothetical protein